MKKNIDKIIIVFGFIVTVVGTFICGFKAKDNPMTTLFSLGLLISVLSSTFIFSKNNIVKNTGYGLAAIVGCDASSTLSLWMNDEAKVLPDALIVSIIGEFIIFAGAILYLILLCFNIFEDSKKYSQTNDLYDKFINLKDLLDKKMINNQEYNDKKEELINLVDKELNELNDLKKWKKLLDQNLITTDDYVLIKEKIL